MVVPTQAGDLDPVALETALMQTWSDEKTFAQSIEERRQGASPFTFLEGPPTANGKPGIHHVISRLFKDCLLYTSPSPRDGLLSRMPSSA